MASITERTLAFTRHGSARGRHRHSTPSRLLGSFRHIVTDSLVRNSASLILYTAFGAACGYGALSLLARLYPSRAIGLAAAAISASALIATVTQFGANYTLPRFLPTTLARNALINTIITATMAASLLGAIIFLALPTASKLYALGGVGFAVIFVLYTSINAGETQLENIFVADRKAYKMTKGVVAGNLVKLAAPVACIVLGTSGAFVAQCLTAVALFVVLATILVRGGDRLRPMMNIAATRELRSYSFGAYLGGQISTLPMMVLPLIILARLGPESNAYWYTSMAIAFLLYQLPGAVARALLAEAAHRPTERRSLIRRSAILIAAVMIPLLLVAYFAAPLGLAALGHIYVAGSLAPLRWLIIAGAVSSVNYVTGTILYVAKKITMIVVINTIDAGLVIALAATLAHSCAGIAMGWLAGEVAKTVLYGIYASHSLYRVKGKWEDLGSEAT